MQNTIELDIRLLKKLDRILEFGTQEELAVELGCSRMTINNIKTNRVNKISVRVYRKIEILSSKSKKELGKIFMKSTRQKYDEDIDMNLLLGAVDQEVLNKLDQQRKESNLKVNKKYNFYIRPNKISKKELKQGKVIKEYKKFYQVDFAGTKETILKNDLIDKTVVVKNIN